MAGESDTEDRTEAATARRLQQVRESGNAPLSQELGSLATLAAATLALGMGGPAAAAALADRLAGLLRRPAAIDLSDGGAQVLMASGLAGLHMAAPVVLAVLAAAAVTVLLQTGFLFSPAALRPDFSHIDPRAGLARLFGPTSAAEALKSLAKLAVIGGAAWHAMAGDLSQARDALLWSPGNLLRHAVADMMRVTIAVLVAQTAIAVLDVLWVRLHHASRLRMSRQDVRDEAKEADGDPRIKARIRQIRMMRARRRMLASVPKATVVITNPTHYAVALAYDRARTAAPRVVAKGVDAMAERIRDIARASRVPLVANPPLARALYTVELDIDIPAEHYRAVAAIIAYVWRLGGAAARRAA